jgi:hypothetical protein
MVKKIIEAHGGTVSVESKVGEGSTFRFMLPVKVGNPPNGPSIQLESLGQVPGMKDGQSTKQS